MEERFDIVKRGYCPSQVDEYIDTLEAVIRGFKEKETSIINAVINAQSISDAIIRRAEVRAGQVEARSKQRQDALLAALEEQMGSLRLFQEEYNTLVSKYLNPSGCNEISRLMSKMNDLRDTLKGVNETANSRGT